MPFTPRKLLIIYDDTRKYCRRVAPGLTQALIDRAFLVDCHSLDSLPSDCSFEDYDGLVLGFPVFGSGRDGGPSQAIQDFVETLGDLDDYRIALFCVYQVWGGPSLLRFQAMLEDKGAEVACNKSYWVFKPDHRAHELPAEIMVRIR